MIQFAEGFRGAMERAYNDVLNDKGDGLNQARAQGLAALVDWTQRRALYDLRCAFDTGNPGDIEWACARAGLAFLMIGDAGAAMEKMFRDAYDGPEDKRKEALDRIYETHSRPLRDINLPPASFQQKCVELAEFTEYFMPFGKVAIEINALSATVKVEWRTKHDGDLKRQYFKAADMVSAVNDAHASLIENKVLAASSNPVGQS